MKNWMVRAEPSRRWTGLAVALLLGLGAVGCDDDPTEPPRIDRSLVVGTYDPTTLTFDVAGPTFGEYNLLDGLQTEEVPPLLVLARDGTVQLVFLDPQSGQFAIGPGTYETTADGVLITFQAPDAPGRLLLPRVLNLTFNEETGLLRFSEQIQAPLGRLVDLVPELEGEPLSNPVGGLLTAMFTPR